MWKVILIVVMMLIMLIIGSPTLMPAHKHALAVALWGPASQGSFAVGAASKTSQSMKISTF